MYFIEKKSYMTDQIFKKNVIILPYLFLCLHIMTKQWIRIFEDCKPTNN